MGYLQGKHMIHLCVVWRNSKWVVTSSDTVMFQEEVHPALKEYYENLIIKYYNDLLKDCTALQAEHLQEIIKRKEVVK